MTQPPKRVSRKTAKGEPPGSLASKDPGEAQPSPAIRTLRAKPLPKKNNRHWAKASACIMVVLGNPRGIRWVMEFAPIYAYVLNGIETAIREQGRRMQVCSARSDVELANLIKQGAPDGLLILASKDIASLKGIIGKIPTVAVLGNSCEGLYDQVTYDGRMTGKLPARYFLEKGIRRVAILGGKESGANATFNARHQGFVETMHAHGGEVLELLSESLYEPGNPSNQPLPAETASLVAQFARARPRPQGLFVMADNLLQSAYAHLREAGVLPGSPLQIVSCNTEWPYLVDLEPEPATVEIPAEEIGRRAVELLSWRQQNPGRSTALTVLPLALRPPAHR